MILTDIQVCQDFDVLSEAGRKIVVKLVHVL